MKQEDLFLAVLDQLGKYGQGSRLFFRVQFREKPLRTLDYLDKIPPWMALNGRFSTIFAV
jgi:hypothetical protein